MPRDRFGEDDDPRPRRPPDDDFEPHRFHGEQSGAVTAVAVINFVVGGIVLLFGICFFIGMAALSGAGGARGAFELPFFGAVMGIAIAICLGIILWGVGAIVAGIGVIKRGQWGRVLTLVLGAFAALVALLFIWGGVQSLSVPAQFGAPQPIGAALLSFLIGLIFLGYTVLAYVILLNPTYGAEFN